MNYSTLRSELGDYYRQKSYADAENTLARASEAFEASLTEGMSAYDMKVLQYRIIAECFSPVIFKSSPFYYETGVVPGFSDGARDFRGHKNAGGLTFWKNRHKFIDRDKEEWALTCRQRSALFYLVCGEYNDNSQHFQINHRPIFEKGLSGVYSDAAAMLASPDTNEHEREFLRAVTEGLLQIKKIAEKFSEKASELLENEPDNENCKRIAASAARCPWNKPESFYEALNTYAFMRSVIGSLEGIGVNSFGRADLDLYPFYASDIKNGKITKNEAYDLISRFLLTFDCRYDHDMKMVGYSDHEFENTYVLGGLNKDGTPLFNELTEMFLTATDEEKIIFPKIKCRFSENSPKEYLDLVNKPIIRGTSTVLYQNDSACIPALIKSGISPSDAEDYIASGCWDLSPNCQSSQSGGNYVNILKVLEYQIHKLTDKMAEVNMRFSPIDDAQSFDEVYKITLMNIRTLFRERLRIINKGAKMWEEVDPLPVFSSLYSDCISQKRDFTAGGARYHNDTFMLVGFPDVTDSLLAIKSLCFDKKSCTLSELLSAVRSNFKDNERIRLEAIHAPGWGDGSEESCSFARKFNSDLYALLSELRSNEGGKINMGHLTYTEIRFWGERTLATPNGRYNGDYFSQGLTPSRLKKIRSVTDVINSLKALSRTECAGNTVVNIILPGGISLDRAEAFLRASAESSVMSLQLNCVSKETLLDAQKHPEKYPDLIVRVCGFSAKFTSLSPEWQAEVISRNFYE